MAFWSMYHSIFGLYTIHCGVYLPERSQSNSSAASDDFSRHVHGGNTPALGVLFRSRVMMCAYRAGCYRCIVWSREHRGSFIEQDSCKIRSVHMLHEDRKALRHERVSTNETNTARTLQRFGCVAWRWRMFLLAEVNQPVNLEFEEDQQLKTTNPLIQLLSSHINH